MAHNRCESLNEYLYESGFQNIVQGVHALNTARKSFRDLIEQQWKHFIARLPDKEKDQLGTYIRCLNRHGMKLYNKHLCCGHENCELLHTRLSKLAYGTGDIYDEQDRESVLQGSQKNISYTNSCFNFIWDLASCFNGVKTHDVKSHGRELNAKTLISLMKNCSLFAFKDSERIYCQILEDVDKLIYTKDLLISKKDLEVLFDHLLELLGHWQHNLQSCSYGVTDIKKIRHENADCENLEYKLLVRNVLEIIKGMLIDSESDLPANIKSEDVSSSKKLISSLHSQVEEIISEQEPNELLEIKQKIESLEEEKKKMKAQIIVKKSNIKAKMKKIRELEENLMQQLHVQVHERKEKDDDIEDGLFYLESLSVKVRNEGSDTKQENTQSKENNLSLQVYTEEMISTIKTLRIESSEIEKNKKRLKEDYSKLQMEIDTLTSSLGEEMTKNPELQWKVKKLEANLERQESIGEAKKKETRELHYKKKKLEADHRKKESDAGSPDFDEEVDDINVLQSVSDELGNNPLHIDLYKRALSRGFETDNTLRVNVVGNLAQGKTSLTQILVGKTRQSVHSTNGVEINHCKYFEANGNVRIFQQSTPDDMEIINRIAEVANSARKTNITKPTKNSERSLELHEHASRSEKKEVIDRVSPILYGRLSLAPILSHILYRKTKKPEEVQIFSTLPTSQQSVRSVDGNLEIWDFAGNFVFYATHTIFHSNLAVYLLVFDLSKALSAVVSDTEYPLETGGKTMEHFILFWINSIHSYVGSTDGSNPPVILVGTHKDKLVGTLKEKKQYAEEYFYKIRTLFEQTPLLNHIHTKDFIVNSTDPDDMEIKELRQEIIHIGKHSKLKVPAGWFALEKELVQIRYKKIIPFSEVVEIDSQNDFPLKEEEQIKLFLLYHHKKGTMIFFDEEPISHFVVLDTQFLVDAFMCIVTPERLCRKEPPYCGLWKLLHKEAKLTMELIEKSFDSNSELSKFKNEILMFLQMFNIISSEVSSFDEITGKCNPLGWYIVPIFLRNQSDNWALKEFLTGKRQTSLRFLMAFHYAFVVQTVYCRLIAAMVARWPVVQIGVSRQRKEVLLYENLGVFRLDKQYAGVIELQQNIIHMRVISLDTSRNVNSISAVKFRRFAESVVFSEFSKLRHSSTIQDKPFQTCFSCNDESHGLNGSQDILILESLEKKRIVSCFDMPICHEINQQLALSEWFEEISTIGLLEDCQVEEKQLCKIAQSIGYNWELLGIELGLSIVEIDHISMDNNTSRMRIYKMLLKWKAKQQENATVNTLLQAMKSTKPLIVVWDEVINIVEQIASTQEK